MQTLNRRMWRNKLRWILVIMTLSTWVLHGCGCEEELPPPKPKAKMRITPKTWIISDKVFQGITVYQKFTISNSAKKGAENLKIRDIKLQDTSKLFTLLKEKKDCPYPPDEKLCKASECVVYSQGKHFCLKLPVSLPIELEPGQGEITFAVGFKPDSSGQSPRSKLIINSNTENNKDEEYIDTDVNLGARGGEPIIEITGKNIKSSGDKELSFSAGKTNKGTTISEIFQISNTGDADLNVTLKWEKEDKQFTVTDENGQPILGKRFTLPPLAKAPANTRKIKVTYKPSDCGSHQARLKVSSNAIYKKISGSQTVSASTLFVRVEGSSPTRADVQPGTLNFGDVKVGDTSVKSFTIAVGPQGLCDVVVYDLKIAPAAQSDPEPVDFTFKSLEKDGAPVTAPTDAKPIVIKKGEKMTVSIEYAPKKKTSIGRGVVKIKTNDPDLDPTNAGVINLAAGIQRNDPPIARFTFRCGEETSNACKKDADLAGSVFKSGEDTIRIVLDSSRSVDREGKLSKYKWEIVKKPTTALAAIKADCADKDTCSFVAGPPGAYEIQLTVWDDVGQKSVVKNILNVQP